MVFLFHMKVPGFPSAIMRVFAPCVYLATVGFSAGQQMTFSGIQQPYQGGVIRPQVLYDGKPREATFSCREIDPAVTVFSNIPESLALSYGSYAFQAKLTSALGNLVNLEGTARVVDHVEVVMVTWAKAESYPALAGLDPTGYRHPVTATVYQLRTENDGTNSLIQLEQNTAWVQIPWRPTTLSNGNSYPYNGFAFKALIPMSAAVTVPENCLIAISYNTRSAGGNPLGVDGPYDELNLALSSTSPSVGLDLNADGVFRIKNGTWSYPATGWGGVGSPMLRLATRATPLPQPAVQATFEPIDAGNYQVRARISPENVEAETVLTIAKALVPLETAGLTRSIADPDPYITVTNQSPGLSVDITYGGLPTPPAKPGRYSFAITVTDRNHTGFLSGDFHLTGLTYEQWTRLEHQPAGEGSADPDSDGQVNWLEYASGGDPQQASQPLRLDTTTGGLRVSFMKRREMPAVRLSLEYSTDLSNWLPAATVTEEADDFWESVSATSALPSACFRLKADVE
jgi:hypothetical protein